MQNNFASNAGTVTLGDLTVNRIGLGTNRVTDVSATRAVLHRAVELGVNFIDTADVYQHGRSEETIGKTLAPYPEGLVIATKAGMQLPDWNTNNDPEHLRTALESSLTRLKISCIDLYQLHRVDKHIPIEDTMGVLKSMQDAGKIRHIGLSDVHVDQIERARSVATIVSVQNQYNLTDRRHEPVLDYCQHNGIVFIPWYPLAKGKLAVAVMEEVALAHNATTAQIAIAWLLARSPVMLPIPGTLSVEHLESNIAAAAIQLTAEEFKRIDAIAPHTQG